ncbi:serine/threonine-protein kinase [Isosphaeraceae bacterium EP7]
MPEMEIDGQALLENAERIGLIDRDQAYEARIDAEDGSLKAVSSVLLRRGNITSWQLDRLKKGEFSGFFYGGCKVLFHIAEGSFARVYRGVKVHGGQPVAIKVLRQRFAADPAAVGRFIKEAEAGIRLVHDNIVRIYEYGESDKAYYMTMEYVEGSNLRDFLRIRGNIGEAQALPLILGLSRGLQHSQSIGITHRDIKGTNILIASNGISKLVDFGLATIEDDKKMATAHGQRTVDYSALERTCASPKGDPRSDIFFLGCVFYQMITGQLPLPEIETKDPLAKMLKRGINSIKPLSEQRHAPSGELSRIIEKMMKVDLKQRYQSMDGVVADLEAYIASKPDAAPSTAPGQTPRARVKVEEELPPDEESFESPLYGDDDDEDDALPQESRPESFEVKAIRPKTLLCVEFQEEIRDAFRKTFAKMGYKVLLVNDPERAVERHQEARPDALVFDADGFGSSALDSFFAMHGKAREEGRDFVAVVLLGPKQKALAAKIPEEAGLIVLVKPLKMREIVDSVVQLAPVV